MDNLTLTDKQRTILKLLYRFRFLTSTHIQHLLNDKTPRLTNYHLKILTSQNYINKHYTRSLGSGNQPAIYFLASGSIKGITKHRRYRAKNTPANLSRKNQISTIYFPRLIYRPVLSISHH